MHNIGTYRQKKMVAAEYVGFTLEADLFKSVLIKLAFVVMHNIETFHHKKKVVAETVGFIFEADLFKSVSLIISCCCHGQH